MKRYTKRRNDGGGVILWAILIGIIGGIVIDYINAEPVTYTYVKTAVAAQEEVIPERQVVQIAVRIDWTEERIIEEIRKVFHETPNTAVAIAKCESELKIDVQSQHILSYGQEESFGIFQIHKPDWHDVAIRLGYEKYQTDVQDNLAMARFIYENAGNTWKDWSCYTQGLYKKHL